MKIISLTKEEFIKRAMQGEEFKRYNGKHIYKYDASYINPFRYDDKPMEMAWNHFNTNKPLFVAIETKIIIERRWRWLKDYKDSTICLDSYYKSSTDFIDPNNWYKNENDYIDVEIDVEIREATLRGRVYHA